ncbi:MAG: biotin--[acetyl-CoA-carboxylase] ligase [Bacillota bacterium]|nr:biotin--[acetyl-CoA-carboxylase] ligase [Bacillota bacterium]
MTARGIRSLKGYRLTAGSDFLSPEGIRAALAPEHQDLDILVYKEIDSTNTEIKRLLPQYAARPLLLIAEQQSQGRGRQGRSFFSPAGTGLYMSLLIHPGAPMDCALAVTTMASVAAARAIRRLCGREVQIKWVNDLYLEGKKVCGILTEAISDFESGTVQSLIIGIGVNIRTQDFPAELAEIGGSLQSEELSRKQLAAEILNQLLPLTANLENHSYLADYRRFSLVLGKDILYYVQGVPHPGLALAIDEQGGLLVRTQEGKEITLRSGEISLRLAEQQQNPPALPLPQS